MYDAIRPMFFFFHFLSCFICQIYPIHSFISWLSVNCYFILIFIFILIFSAKHKIYSENDDDEDSCLFFNAPILAGIIISLAHSIEQTTNLKINIENQHYYLPIHLLVLTRLNIYILMYTNNNAMGLSWHIGYGSRAWKKCYLNVNK